jgi:hypothetical protein
MVSLNMGMFLPQCISFMTLFFGYFAFVDGNAGGNSGDLQFKG